MSFRMRALVLAAAFASVASAAHAAPPAIADFLARDDFGELRISPSGKYLASVVEREEGNNALVVLRIDDMVPISDTHFEGKRRIGDFAWVGDDRLVFSIAIKSGSLERPRPTGEWFGVDADGGRQVVLIDAKDRYEFANIDHGVRGVSDFYLLDTPHADASAVRMQVDRHLGESGHWQGGLLVMDTVTGRHLQVADSPAMNCDLVLGADGAPAYANCAVTSTREGDWADDVDLYRHAAGKWTLVNRSAETHRFLSADHAGTDGRMYAWSGDGRGPAAFGTLDAATGAFTALHAGTDADVHSVLRGADGRSVFGVMTQAAQPKVELVDGGPAAAADAALYLAVAKRFPGRYAEFTSASRDGARIVVSVTGDDEPTEWYLLDRANGQARFLARDAAKLDRAHLAKVKPFAFDARDGTTLHGYLTVPDAPAPDAGRPLVVLPHGGPMGIRDDWFYDRESQLLASRGYLVLRLNYRGSSGFGPAFMLKGFGQWGQAMQDDLTDATRWAFAQKLADPARACIVGASYGAYAALMGAAKEPTLYRCAAGLFGVYDLLRIVDEERDSPYAHRFFKATLGEDRAELKLRSPARLADRIAVPVFLAAGKADHTAPVEHTQQMRTALKRAGNPPKDLLIVEHEGHGFYSVENNITLYTRLLAFLDAHIGPGAAAPATPVTP
jgi:dipeptidyl aminopeptidase/acylaminoacyl peptidase